MRINKATRVVLFLLLVAFANFGWEASRRYFPIEQLATGDADDPVDCFEVSPNGQDFADYSDSNLDGWGSAPDLSVDVNLYDSPAEQLQILEYKPWITVVFPDKADIVDENKNLTVAEIFPSWGQSFVAATSLDEAGKTLLLVGRKKAHPSDRRCPPGPVSLIWWDPGTRTRTSKPVISSPIAWSGQLSPDGQRAVLFDARGLITVVDTATRKLLWRAQAFPAQDFARTRIAISENDQLLGVGTLDGHVTTFDLETGHTLWSKQFPASSTLRFSPQGDMLAITGWQVDIDVVAATTGQNLMTLRVPVGSIKRAGETRLCWPDHGKLLATEEEEYDEWRIR